MELLDKSSNNGYNVCFRRLLAKLKLSQDNYTNLEVKYEDNAKTGETPLCSQDQPLFGGCSPDCRDGRVC